MKKSVTICVSIVFAVLAIGPSRVIADMGGPQFSITYYDNYNNIAGSWEPWNEAAGQQYWNNEYLANFSSGNTNATDHYFTGISTFDLRGGLWSKDGHGTDEDWNPLESVRDTVSGQSAHHVFAATFTGPVYFEAGDVLSLESDDDAYVFLDSDTNWGDEILSEPGIHYFYSVSTVIPPGLAGYHTMTVKFAERCDSHSGIQINLNGEPLPAVPVPGAALLGLLGLGVAGLGMRRFA